MTSPGLNGFCSSTFSGFRKMPAVVPQRLRRRSFLHAEYLGLVPFSVWSFASGNFSRASLSWVFLSAASFRTQDIGAPSGRESAALYRAVRHQARKSGAPTTSPLRQAALASLPLLQQERAMAAGSPIQYWQEEQEDPIPSPRGPGLLSVHYRQRGLRGRSFSRPAGGPHAWAVRWVLGSAPWEWGHT